MNAAWQKITDQATGMPYYRLRNPYPGSQVEVWPVPVGGQYVYWAAWLTGDHDPNRRLPIPGRFSALYTTPRSAKRLGAKVAYDDAWLRRVGVRTRETFDDIHREGSQRWGLDWLAANIAAKEAAERYGLDPAIQKTAISAIVAAVLRVTCLPTPCDPFATEPEIQEAL